MKPKYIDKALQEGAEEVIKKQTAMCMLNKEINVTMGKIIATP